MTDAVAAPRAVQAPLRGLEAVVVLAEAQGETGLGYAYASPAAAAFIAAHFKETLLGADAMSPAFAYRRMRDAARNAGWPGVGAMAASAVEAALWDLKGRLLGLPVAALLGSVRRSVPVYGSGGFTSMGPEALRRQLGAWARRGFAAVKMKVGRDPRADPRRVEAAREAVGDPVRLYVDANGAYERREALALARAFASSGVTRFEEPVSSDDLEGLRLIRERLPPGMELSAGEYGWDGAYFARMLNAGAVDVLQADATRCGVSGFIAAAELCSAAGVPLSAHTAPSLHLHLGAALPAVRELEWFHDHARVERLLFEGFREPVKGRLAPDLSRPGWGLTLRPEAERYHEAGPGTRA